MKFFDYIKNFFIFTIKEIYSFFLKLALLFFIFFIFIVSSVKYFESKNERTKRLKQYDYVLFNPAYLTEDKIVGNGLIANSEISNLSFSDILESLNHIQNNPNIKGIIIALDDIDLSSAKNEELIKKFDELKKAGKKIYAYGAYLDNKNYPLAASANEIIMIPSSSAGVSLTGYSYNSMYFKKFLDNVGINMEVVRIGDFKSYGENYTSNSMSEGLKDEITRIMNNRYNNFINNVSNIRKINRTSLENNIENGNFVNMTPFEARDSNLIDKLETYENFMERLNITNENITDIYGYYSDKKNEIVSKNKGNDTIAVIYAEGTIIYGTINENTIHISPENIKSKLERALKTNNLKGIVLRVNSPGGSALASEVIYQTLSKLDIPIYVSMSETAASGGYYISMAGDKIFADKATITGSIGVVSMIPKLYNLQNKYGVTSNSITKGKFSDMYNPFTPLTEETRKKISTSMEATYKEFKSRVASNRKLEDTILENYSQGKIWLGDEAKNIKLIDGIAGLEETIKLMSKDLGLEDNYHVENIYTEKDFTDTLKMMATFLTERFSPTSQIKAKIPKSSKYIDEYKFIEENQNRPLYYLPYNLEF